MDFKYEFEKLKEKLLMAIAWSMPRSLVYYCAIRVGVHATTTGPHSKQIVPNLNFMDALRRWEV